MGVYVNLKIDCFWKWMLPLLHQPLTSWYAMFGNRGGKLGSFLFFWLAFLFFALFFWRGSRGSADEQFRAVLMLHMKDVVWHCLADINKFFSGEHITGMAAISALTPVLLIIKGTITDIKVLRVMSVCGTLQTHTALPILLFLCQLHWSFPCTNL